MRHDRNLTFVYVNKPMLKLVSLYSVLLEVTEPIANVKWGLPVPESSIISYSSFSYPFSNTYITKDAFVCVGV